MGIRVKLNCPECGYETILNLGGGMMGCNLRVIKEMFSGDEFFDFLTKLDNKEIDTFIMEQDLMCCKSCQELISVPTLHYTLHGGQSRVIRNNCPKCEGEMTEQKQSNHCPKCKAKLQSEEIGLWD